MYRLHSAKQKERKIIQRVLSLEIVSIWMSWILDLVQILFKINENVFGSNYMRQ